jgi:predicted anti-sigma-YlaC factor YlaD
MRDRHLDERTVRAYLDDELGWGASALCTAHLRRCAPCRALLDEHHRLDQDAAGLLARLALPTDTEAGWRRVRPPRRGHWPLRGAWAAGALVLGVVLGTALPRAFVGRAPSGGPVKDVCCWDLDGGPRADDGVVTVSTEGEAVACVILYDDVDGSRSFSRGDVVRFATASGMCPDPGAVRATPSAGAMHVPSLGGLPLALR